MNKNSFTIDFFPINHFLIGFSYQSGISDENDNTLGSGVDIFSLGFGLINFNYHRFYKIS